jgi:lysozyme family protein
MGDSNRPHGGNEEDSSCHQVFLRLIREKTLDALREEYQAFFDRCVPRPEKAGEIAFYVKKLNQHRPRYQAVGERLNIP